MADERKHPDHDDRGRTPVEAEQPETPERRGGAADLDMGGTESHRRPSFADPIAPGDPDGVLGPPPDAPRRE